MRRLADRIPARTTDHMENARERSGTLGNARERSGTLGNAWERFGSLREHWPQIGTGLGVTTDQVMNPTAGRCKVLFCDEIQAFFGAPLSNGRINALVCMFNRFALAKPLCHRMKIAALGSSVRG